MPDYRCRCRQYKHVAELQDVSNDRAGSEEGQRKKEMRGRGSDLGLKGTQTSDVAACGRG